MSDRQAPGEKTSRRISARMEAGLQRKETPGGGEVYTGSLARQALRAMDARAMTLDHSIIVDEDFDASDPEDAALYAHEAVHQANSGGEGAQGSKDGEEVAARAVERMVLHRMQSGEDAGTVMRQVTSRAGTAGGPPSSAGPAPSGESTELDEAAAAYASMLQSGRSHEFIVRELTTFVVREMQRSEEANRIRVSPSKSL